MKKPWEFFEDADGKYDYSRTEDLNEEEYDKSWEALNPEDFYFGIYNEGEEDESFLFSPKEYFDNGGKIFYYTEPRMDLVTSDFPSYLDLVDEASFMICRKGISSEIVKEDLKKLGFTYKDMWEGLG